MAGVTLSALDTDLLAATVAACVSEPPETPLPWPVLELLDRLVPSDDIMFNGVDSSAQGFYVTQSMEGSERFLEVPDQPGSGPEEEPFWAHYWAQCAAPELTRDFTSITRISDTMSFRQWWASPMRVDYLREIRSEIMLAMDDGGARTARLLFFRTSGRDFDERERLVLALLRPHLESCYRNWQRQHPAASMAAPLTARQRELVHLLGAGLTNRQIARRMGLSEGTVRTHLINVYHRLGVNSRTAAVMWVIG